MEEVTAHDYCPMTPLEHKKPVFFSPLTTCRLPLISGALWKGENNWDFKSFLQKYFINPEVFAQGFCGANWRWFCATALEGLSESRNPRWMRNDRSWAAGNEFSAGISCWTSTSVQKASRGLILYLNLLLWLLKMLTLLSTGLGIWQRGNWQSQWIIIINACIIV